MADAYQQTSAARRPGSAIGYAFVAVIIAIVALVFALRAENKAHLAQDRANQAISKVNKLSSHVDNVLGNKQTTPSTGAGVGPNTTNPVPNGNGQ
jgi:hypothetical protein